jgi:AraC family transcriptional regulator of adaptative response/methylated-DNA-[protein]-cysteine methyltransferase
MARRAIASSWTCEEAMSESATRERATVRYALRPCSLGYALVAVSEDGVCAILLGDARAPLVEELYKRFPLARLAQSEARDDRLVDAALALVDAPGEPVAFPISAQGTDFQKRVWRALRAIAPGRTANYAEIARAIGAPKAVRAVAGACAANPIAVAIPCHRVLRKDGALSGYRWGAARKKALLAREGVAV